MTLSVIIPTCNRNDLLSKCLDLLHPSIQKIDTFYEVIVSDDSQENVARNLIEEKYRWVTWVEGPRKGPAANRNNGAKNARGEWFLFVDDDCLPLPGILKEYEKSISEYSEILAFEGRIFVDTKPTSLVQESPINESGGKFWSCNICLHSQLFNSLNGFDEKFPFPAMEDVDLFKRLKEVTDKHMFLYKAAVLHPWRTNKNYFKTVLNRHKSQLYFIAKHSDERSRMGAKFYFNAFVILFSSTIKNAWQVRFSGFCTKACCDFFQLYFALCALFNTNQRNS